MALGQTHRAVNERVEICSSDAVEEEDRSRIKEIVFAFFSGDDAKANAWMNTVNPVFGMTSTDYAEIKGWKRLLRWVETSIAENERASDHLHTDGKYLSREK